MDIGCRNGGSGCQSPTMKVASLDPPSDDPCQPTNLWKGEHGDELCNMGFIFQIRDGYSGRSETQFKHTSEK